MLPFLSHSYPFNVSSAEYIESSAYIKECLLSMDGDLWWPTMSNRKSELRFPNWVKNLMYLLPTNMQRALIASQTSAFPQTPGPLFRLFIFSGNQCSLPPHYPVLEEARSFPAWFPGVTLLILSHMSFFLLQEDVKCIE